jgi:proteasome lid subunit RPN8/RPN11
VVLEAWPCANVAEDQASGFAIAPEQQGDFIATMEAIDVELIGSYHSHPNGKGFMSPADVQTARATGLLLIVAPGQRWEWCLWDPDAGGGRPFEEAAFRIATPWEFEPIA